MIIKLYGTAVVVNIRSYTGYLVFILYTYPISFFPTYVGSLKKFPSDAFSEVFMITRADYPDFPDTMVEFLNYMDAIKK